MHEREIFTAALNLPDPTERATFLDRTCAGDAALRQRVEVLLRNHARAGGFLERPAVEQLGADPPLSDCTAAAEPSAPDEKAQPAAHAVDPQVTRAEEGGNEPPLDFLGPPRVPDQLGRLGHYDVTGVIGQGGMGVVLKAFDQTLHRVVAIKALAPALAGSATARQRFLREARAAAAVTHEHVVTIHAVEEGDKVPYLVMQCVAGMSLQDKLDRVGPLDVKEILRIGMQTAAGLAAAHAQGLVHRDVKPANILLENGVERVKLTDFGLARAANDASLTQSGLIAGTPQYMSPEQAEGRALDHRSDLFSLGSVLYAVCTGRPPFRASSVVAVLKRVCEDTPRPIREINPDIPDWLCAVIDRLHAKEPTARFQSAAEVSTLLGQQLARLQQPLLTLPPVEGTERSRPATERPSAHRPVSPTRWRSPVVAAALLFLLLAGVGLTEATGVTHLAGTVIRLFTPEGTLLIQVDDPQVKVTLDGEDIVIHGAGPQEVRLKAGTHRLRAMKDGQAVREELVNITRGGRQVVAIQRESQRATAGVGWVPLFNGRDLTGWVPRWSAPGAWKVAGSLLIGSGDRYGELVTERGTFENYELRLEARINAGGDSGVFNRFHLNEGGYEVQIGCHAAPRPHTGAVLFVGGGKGLDNQRNARAMLTVPDQWFTLEIAVRDNRIVTRVNGTTTVDFVDPGRRYSRGHIVLQLLKNTVVEFRKIEIKELPNTATAARPFASQQQPATQLQGTWALVASEQDGKMIPAKEVNRTFHFTGKRWELKDGEQLLNAGTFQLIDLGEQLMGIDRQQADGGAIKDIIHLEGDMLKSCTPPAGGDRPRKFATTAAGTYSLWQRVVKEKAEVDRAFVVLTPGGERAFATLAEAVVGASDGDTIEIRGDGPFSVEAVTVKRRALKIRAGAGCRPVLQLNPEAIQSGASLLRTDAALVLEGLEFRRIAPLQAPRERPQGLIHSFRAPLFVSNCRFISQGSSTHTLYLFESPHCEVRNSEFLGEESPISIYWRCPPAGSLVLDNCIQTGHFGVLLQRHEQEIQDLRLRLTRNTITGQFPVGHSSPMPPPGQVVRPLRVETAENIFDSSRYVLEVSQGGDVPEEKRLTPAQVEGLVGRLVTWHGERNLYPSGIQWLRLTSDWKRQDGFRINNLSEWKKLWGAETGSLQGRPRYEGGDVVARASTPQKLTPADFRLRADSPGKSAGVGGRDLGAAVELVGPGAAWERWQKTPEYQAWLKATGNR